MLHSSEDINRQLPVESKRYQTMERVWRKILNNAKNNPQVLYFFDSDRHLLLVKNCLQLARFEAGITGLVNSKLTLKYLAQLLMRSK